MPSGATRKEATSWICIKFGGFVAVKFCFFSAALQFLLTTDEGLSRVTVKEKLVLQLLAESGSRPGSRLPSTKLHWPDSIRTELTQARHTLCLNSRASSRPQARPLLLFPMLVYAATTNTIKLPTPVPAHIVCVCARAPGIVGIRMRVIARSLAYPTCNAYGPHCDVISGPSGPITFLVIISETARFSGKNYSTQNVFLFYLQPLSKTFIFVRRIQRDIILNVKTISCKVHFTVVGY